VSASVPEDFRDLLRAPVGVLATVGRDGRPQLSAVWFLAEGDGIKLSLNTSRQKTKNLERNPAVNLFIFDPTGPRRYLEIRGDAEVTPDSDYEVADAVGAKYGGVDLRSRDRPGEGRVAVTIRPVRVRAVDMTRPAT